ncbi:MAG: SAM-dependent chlorinase/fluorinase, partial [Desulfobacteraceae bacterium]|nr:SAM-dependent chlorinase/fluorinase [Desulfobacteraceae bacterium]
SAAFVLFTAYEYFPHGTIHLVVVDPGVGTERKPLAIRTRSHFFVGPDNGVFSLVLAREENWEARCLENPRFRREPVSMTFHGRDLFAPVAAHLACGTSFDRLGPVCSPAEPPWGAPVIGKGRIEGEVIHVDRFGNAVTNVPIKDLEEQAPAQDWTVAAGDIVITGLKGTYGQARPQEVLGLAGSSGFVEIAVNQGSAASLLGLGPGLKVQFLLA